MDFDRRTFREAVLIFWAIVLAVLLFVLFCLPANADVRVEIGTGYSFGVEQADGSGYFQSALPNWVDTDDQALSLGVTWQPAETIYRAEFLTIGKQSVKATIVEDHNYNPYYLSHCAADCKFYTIMGNGSISGVVLSVSRHVNGSPFYIEAGLYPHVTKWKAKLYSTDGRLMVEVEREHSIDIGPMMGIGWRSGGIDIGMRYIYLDDSAEGDPLTPMLKDAYVVMARWSF